MNAWKKSALGGLALSVCLLGMAMAQGDDGEKVPQYKKADSAAAAPAGLAKRAYFVAADPYFADFNLDGASGDVHYTTPNGGQWVVEAMKLKYVGDDGTGYYYEYQNDVQAGALVWFIPKARRGRVYFMYGGTASPVIQYYGPSVGFPAK